MRERSEIDTSVVSLEELVSGRFLNIPSYQRGYCWPASEVKKFFFDLLNDFLSGNISLMGQIKASLSPYCLDITDGQQRITTLSILLAAARDILLHLESQDSVLGKINGILKMNFDDKVSPRIQPQHVPSQNAMSGIVKGVDFEANSPPSTFYKSAYSLCCELLSETFGEDEQQFIDFANAVCAKTYFILVVTPEKDAITSFMRENDRGVPLAAIDRLKGRVLDATPEHQRNNVVKEFNKVAEIIWDCSESADRIVGHVATAITGKKYQLQEGVDALTYISSGRELEFVQEDLYPAVKAYANIVQSMRPNGTRCAPLRDIKSFARLNRFKGYRPLLVAGAKLSNEEFDELVVAIMWFIFVCSTAGVNPPETEKLLANLTKTLKEEQNVSTVIESLNTQKMNYAPPFWEGLSSTRYSVLGDKGIRFVLGSIERNLQQRAGMSTSFNSKTSILEEFGANIDVEHILPVSQILPSENFADPTGANERLGNFTLLESTINRSIQDKSHSEKLKGYSGSRILHTKSIASPIGNGGKKNKIAIVDATLKQFPKWNENALLERERLIRSKLAEVAGLGGAIPELVKEDTREIRFFQGRPENCIKGIEAIQKSSALSRDDLAEFLSNKNGKRGSTGRQADYTIQTLEILGVILHDEGNDIVFTDFGEQLFSEPNTEEEIKEGLRKAFVMWGDSAPQIRKILNALKVSEGDAISSLINVTGYSTSTARHRIGAIIAFVEL